MRLVKQATLFFREGNSDKVYEISLSEVGQEQYVVNFKYGRRGAALKEGSKTPVPVALAVAERLYDEIETQKLAKGYTTSQSTAPVKPVERSFSLSSLVSQPSNLWMQDDASKNKSVLLRLHQAVENPTATQRFPWPLSRVVWKAGEYKIAAAVPYLILLFGKHRQMHQYCCTWSLVRCGSDSSLAVAALQQIFNQHPEPGTSKLAGAGLMTLLQGAEKELHAQHFVNQLPEAFKAFLNLQDAAGLQQLASERLSQNQPNYNWLEPLYILSLHYKWMKPMVKHLLTDLPLKAGWFKHIRRIFKIAELTDDFETMGLLGCRIEREEEMFHQPFSLRDSTARQVYVPLLEEWVKIQSELKKATSRLAYSQKTRWYFHRRILRKLKLYAHHQDLSYVKLASAILIAYHVELDGKPHFSTFKYRYENGSYQRVEHLFLENAQAVFMHFILSANHPDIILQHNHLWRRKNSRDRGNAQSRAAGNSSSSLSPVNVIHKILRFFGSKKQTVSSPVPAANTSLPDNSPNAAGTPFLELWNKLPQAFVQLLLEAEMDEIHLFAAQNLLIHPQWPHLIAQIDEQATCRLLRSKFLKPAEIALTIVQEKYSALKVADAILLALLNCVDANARLLGKNWVAENLPTHLANGSFIATAMLAQHTEVRKWWYSILVSHPLETALNQNIIVRIISALVATEELQTQPDTISDVSDFLLSNFAPELQEVSMQALADLLAHQNEQVMLFGLRLLKLKQNEKSMNELSAAFLFGLLQHSSVLVRKEGLELVTKIETAALLQQQVQIVSTCLSAYPDVRIGLWPVVNRMAKAAPNFGTYAAETLMPVLLRKESADGIHNDIADLICQVLSDYLTNANREHALHLLYGNYKAAQKVGIVILEKYTSAAQLTIAQVVALGSHENKLVREWCWQFFETEVYKIKYEAASALKLLDAKWEDTLDFAVVYFDKHFTAQDWTPELMITLADSPVAKIEALGRSLINKYFTADHGTAYLLQLSQHPSEKMQLFVTNYLQQYAAGNPEQLKKLEFYFRSILARVNKGRIAKTRVLEFLQQQGLQSEEAAKIVAGIITDISATAAIADKAKCIEILLLLSSIYSVATPLVVKETIIKTA
jgi:hypothetical protein